MLYVAFSASKVYTGSSKRNRPFVSILDRITTFGIRIGVPIGSVSGNQFWDKFREFGIYAGNWENREKFLCGISLSENLFQNSFTIVFTTHDTPCILSGALG